MDPKSDYSGIVTPQYNPDGNVTQRVRADKRAIELPQGALVPFVLALDNAQPSKEFAFSGDSIYVDRRSTGIIRFRLDMAWPAAFPLGPNDGVKNLPYKQLLLEWDAQPGLQCFLWTGYGVELALSLGAISSIGSILSPVSISNGYGSSFQSSSNIAANAIETIVSPGSNLNGVRIVRWGYAWDNSAASVALLALHARSSAPAAFTDGDILAMAPLVNVNGASNSQGRGQMETPTDIASGKGIYHGCWLANVVSNGGHLLYTLK